MKKINKYIKLHLLLIFYSFSGVFSKLATENGSVSIKFYIISIMILGIYTIFWQQIIKEFTLTTAFFNKAVIIIWGTIWGEIFFGEIVTINMIIGIMIVLIGIKMVVNDYE